MTQSSLSARRRISTRRQIDDAFTVTEVVVAGVLAEGWGNKEIADRLGRSVGTIKHHVGSIMRKMRVNQRARAVALLRGAALLDGERMPEPPRARIWQ